VGSSPCREIKTLYNIYLLRVVLLETDCYALVFKTVRQELTKLGALLSTVIEDLFSLLRDP
jgi:hypothetical protein